MEESNRKVIDLPIDDILPNRYQPRIKFDDDSIFELAESIKVHGVFQPILVRPIADKYEIIAGERRYKASVLAGRKTIPAIIMNLNDKDTVEIALIENVQRSNLSPIEEAISYKRILDMGYIKQEDLARKLGKTQSTIANKLRLLNLDEDVQEALIENKISERHARSLLRLKDTTDQKILLKRIINERLTVRRTDEEIEKMLRDSEEVVTPVVITDIKEDNIDIEPEIPEIEVSPIDVVPQDSVFGFSDDSISTINTQSANESTVISSSPVENIETIEVVEPNINEIEKNAAPVFENFDSPNKPKEVDVEKLLEPEKIEVNPEEVEIESKPSFTGKFFSFDPLEEPKEEKPADQTFQFNNFVESKNTVDDSESAPSFEDFFNNQSTTTMSDDIIIPSTTENTTTVAETINNDSTIVVPNVEPASNNIKDAIEIIRDATKKLENLGFKVDVDELDLESIYQVMIKIDK